MVNLLEHKRIAEANPNLFIELLKRKASSNPLRKKLSLFLEAVIIMAGGDNRVKDVRSANSLIPGHAKVAGSSTPVFGYLWESVAFQPQTEEEPVTSVCFLTINERGMFNMLYGNNPAAPVSLRFEDFEEETQEKQ